MKKILLFCTALIITATSCDEWLDVRPEEQSTSTEMFESYDGFCDALNGCYIKMKERSLYGEKLTMSDIEELAALWRMPNETLIPHAYELRNFNYTGDNAKSVLAGIYSGLYNVIANVNMVINHIEENAAVFPDEATRKVIEGEAYAIRAFCHFDVLRLFGQLPQNAVRQVSLPYAEKVSASDLPPYYNYEEFKAKVEADLVKAESLLKDNDPLFAYTFTQLNNGESNDDFMNYRQGRFNYWAVRAIQARFYLYTGNTGMAYQIAKSIINATGADGDPLITLSGVPDITAGYLACPSECLLMMNVYNLTSYTTVLLAAGTTALIEDKHYVITQAQLTELFEGQHVASHNRFLNLWDRSLTDISSTIYPALKKYYYDAAISVTPTVNLTKRQVVPLIRLSEMYLIAMETTADLAEANALWADYQLSHNVLITQDAFTSLEAVKTAMIDEYRRELFGEGQMFYTYKRINAATMLWRTETVTEENYIVPLPETEFNPNL